MIAHDRELVPLPSTREMLAPVFRHRRVVLLTFAFVAALAVTTAVTWPARYESRMTILVKRERLDPVLTADPTAPASGRIDVEESELYSEIALLQSRDLLERVVVSRGLAPDGRADTRRGARTAATSSRDLEAAVRRLQEHLTVTPIRKTTMIAISYRAGDPREAAGTLDALAQLYLEKHLAVHRPAGAHGFFKTQTEQAQNELNAAQADLRAFTAREQVVSAATERESVLQKLAEFEAGLQQIEASMADSDRRLRSIQTGLAATPDRQVTQMRNSANVELVRGIKSQLLQLEIKRQEMLTKFTPTYTPVVQLQQEIDRLQAAISDAEREPLRDETTDQNPTSQWLRNEQARVRTERDALAARATAMRRTIEDYRDRAQRLDGQRMEEGDLLRRVKAAEENYLLYQRKEEEARISDALDQRRIANVAIADAPRLPETPVGPSRAMILTLGLMLAGLCAAGVTFFAHKRHPYFRTPAEVLEVLDVPVLATLPAAREIADV